MELSLIDRESVVVQMDKFRKNMGSTLTPSLAKRIWGIDLPEYIQDSTSDFSGRHKIVQSKVSIARSYLNVLSIPLFVKYVSISGSVAAGIPKESDDIDIFVVVNNHTTWIYKPLVKLLLKNSVLWFGQKNQQDKLCINFIAEERGVHFQNKDIFILHELYSLIHLYNPEYWNQIITQNNWVYTEFAAQSVGPYISSTQSKIKSALISIIFFLPNLISFILHLFYMTILSHKPDYMRLIIGYLRGQAQFYPSDFRDKILKQINVLLESESLK